MNFVKYCEAVAANLGMEHCDILHMVKDLLRMYDNGIDPLDAAVASC